MELKLTDQEIKDIFHTAMCNGLVLMPGYGMQLTFENEHYEAAKAKLESRLCFEDVLLAMLEQGYELTMIDDENDGDMTSTIKMEDVLARVPTVPIKNLLRIIEEEDDADDADAVLQTVFFKEIVFG